MPKNTVHASSEALAMLPQLIYRAGFAHGELQILHHEQGGGIIRLPAGHDPTTFRVRDLGHMLKAYGLPYEILSAPDE
jgi:hypothetical protein